MSVNPDRHEETSQERAERDPIGMQRDWLHAHEENTGEETLEGAIDVATNTDTEAISDAARSEARERDQHIRTRFG